MMQTTFPATVPRCLNEEYRRRAHELLDEQLERADSVKSFFGTVGIELTVQSGQFCNLKETSERNHKLK